MTPDRPLRRVVRSTALVLGAVALAWSCYLWLAGGIDGEILGQRVTTHEPLRPLLIASVALTIFILSGGVIHAFHRWLAAIAAVDDRLPVAGLVVATTLAGVMFGTTAASGADAYGYVSQAELWLSGDLRVEQPFTADLPWPSRAWSFAPLGYRPIERPGVWAIVPTYSPGLPMLMAAVKAIGGHCAMFWIVPLSGGLLVLATYGLGRRLGSSRAGLMGAWLVATSPALLFMLMWPMTDVPVAAAWAGALYFALGSSRRSVVAAGLLTALAILIRPNLVILAPVVGLWYLFRRFSDALLFSLAVVPGAVAVAAINNYLYGSPLESGYTGLGGMFDAANMWPNFRLYFGWFAESQSWLAFAGLIAVLVPLRRFWPGVDRRVFWMLGTFVVLLWALYLSYLVFDSWWYLRFLLASWPIIMVGVGAVAMAIVRLNRPALTAVTVLTVIGLGIFNFTVAIDRSAFELWQGERRYVSAGRLVGRLTEPDSVIFSMQHSGSVRYYSGRLSLRFDNLDADWLDRGVAWLAERGITSYLLIEDWEEPDFKRRFAGQSRLDRLELPPIFVYTGPAKITLYDLTRARPRESAVQQIIETNRGAFCVPPAPDAYSSRTRF